MNKHGFSWGGLAMGMVVQISSYSAMFTERYYGMYGALSDTMDSGATS